MDKIKRIYYFLHDNFLFFQVFYKDETPLELFQYEKKNKVWVPVISEYLLKEKDKLYERLSRSESFSNKTLPPKAIYIKTWREFYDKESTRLIRKYRIKLLFNPPIDFRNTLFEN